MSTLFKPFIYITLSFLILLSSELSMASAQIIKRFELKTCHSTERRCIILSAQEAQSGEISPLLSLKESRLIYINERGQEQIYDAKRGYVDLQNNKIVMRTQKSKELSLDLQQMTITEFHL